MTTAHQRSKSVTVDNNSRKSSPPPQITHCIIVGGASLPATHSIATTIMECIGYKKGSEVGEPHFYAVGSDPTPRECTATTPRMHRDHFMDGWVVLAMGMGMA